MPWNGLEPETKHRYRQGNNLAGPGYAVRLSIRRFLRQIKGQLQGLKFKRRSFVP